MYTIICRKGLIFDHIFFYFSYYFNGRTATVEEFLNNTVMNSLADNIKDMQDVIDRANCSHLPVWLGETASAYGGGAPHLSDSYVSGFL